MAYQNPGMDALTSGGQMANQGMSVANSMMMGVQKAMDSTSDLTFKMTTLLKNEEAKKIEQSLQLNKQMQDMYQSELTNQMQRDRTAVMNRNAETREGSLKVAQDELQIKQEEHNNYLSDVKTLNSEEPAVNVPGTIKPPAGINTGGGPTVDNAKGGATEIPTLSTPGVPKGITPPVNYDTQIENLTKDTQRIYDLPVKSTKGKKEQDRRVAKNNNKIKMIEAQKKKHLTGVSDQQYKSTYDDVATSLDKVDYSDPIKAYTSLTGMIDNYNNLASSAHTPAQKTRARNEAKRLEKLMKEKLPASALGISIVEKFIRDTDGSTDMGKFADYLVENRYPEYAKETATKYMDKKVGKLEKEATALGSGISNILSMEEGVEPFTDTSKGSYEGLRNLYRAGGKELRTTIDRLVKDNKDKPGAMDSDLFAKGMFGLADNESLSNSLYTSIKSDKKLNKAFNLMYKKMKNPKAKGMENLPDLYDMSGIMNSYNENKTISEMNEDELLSFMSDVFPKLTTETLDAYIKTANK